MPPLEAICPGRTRHRVLPRLGHPVASSVYAQINRSARTASLVRREGPAQHALTEAVTQEEAGTDPTLYAPDMRAGSLAQTRLRQDNCCESLKIVRHN